LVVIKNNPIFASLNNIIKSNTMARKVYVEVKVKLIINIDEGTTVEDVLSEMEYEFTTSTDVNADIDSTEILGFEITDSK